jgi:hypothetical protein
MAKKRLSDLLRDEAQKTAVTPEPSDPSSVESSPPGSAAAPSDPIPTAVDETVDDPADGVTEPDAAASDRRPKPPSRMTKAELEQAWQDSQQALAAAETQLAAQATDLTARDRQLQTLQEQVDKLKGELDDARQVILRLSEENQRRAKPAPALSLSPPPPRSLGTMPQRPVQPNGLPPMPSERLPVAPPPPLGRDRRPATLPPMSSDRLPPPPAPLPRPVIGYGNAPQPSRPADPVALPPMSTDALRIRRLPPMPVDQPDATSGDRLSEADIGWVD